MVKSQAMRMLLMLGAVVVAGLTASSCHKRAQIYVPDTVEGNACKRECMQVLQTCRAARRNKRHTCDIQGDECLMTCPGAVY